MSKSRQKAREAYEKRMKRGREKEETQYKNTSILEILPVIDNFNLAVSHVSKEDKEASWMQGILHIKKQLEAIVKELGVSEIKALQEEFNPNLHECLEEVSTGDKKDKGKVVVVSQKGYKMGDKVIRAAKVKIGK